MGKVLSEKQIDYTDLICSTIESGDYEDTKRHFEEALKEEYYLDFSRIISTIGQDDKHVEGANVLSTVLLLLPSYDFDRYLDNTDSETNEVYIPFEDFEKDLKALVMMVINLSDEEVIQSESVKEAVYESIKPGYSQIIYSDILFALSRRGFTVGDNYFSESLAFLDDSIVREYFAHSWEYLYNLYSSFTNRALGTNLEFPSVKRIKDYEYGTTQNNNVFVLICEHIKRNFVIYTEDLPNQDQESLQAAQDKLLSEIMSYIGILDYRQILALIDDCPIIDADAMNRNFVLPYTLQIGDTELSRELIQRGVTIITHNKNGTDITGYICSPEQIEMYESLQGDVRSRKADFGNN